VTVGLPRLECLETKRALEPGEEIPPVGDGAAFNHTAAIGQVAEQTLAGIWLALVQDAVGTRSPDHQRRSLAGGAAGAEVRAGAVAKRREDLTGRTVAERWEQVRADPERVEQLRVPVSLAQVEQAGARSGRESRAQLAGQPQEEVVGKRDRPPGPLERTLLPQPHELCRPEARV
jgi:hypothetical protein